MSATKTGQSETHEGSIFRAAYQESASGSLRCPQCPHPLDLMVGNAELIPLPDESQDAVTSILMFHELPPKVRRIVLSEFARVLKPGGRLVLVDSLQHGDEPDYDGLLELFPQSFHEPYYLSYIKEDFAALCQDRGLTYIRNARAFVSKVIVFDKPAGPAATAARTA